MVKKLKQEIEANMLQTFIAFMSVIISVFSIGSFYEIYNIGKDLVSLESTFHGKLELQQEVDSKQDEKIIKLENACTSLKGVSYYGNDYQILATTQHMAGDCRDFDWLRSSHFTGTN